jgi:hypothetical protein
VNIADWNVTRTTRCQFSATNKAFAASTFIIFTADYQSSYPSNIAYNLQNNSTDGYLAIYVDGTEWDSATAGNTTSGNIGGLAVGSVIDITFNNFGSSGIAAGDGIVTLTLTPCDCT